MKLTKRKGFNFFRSYYDVFNEIPDSKDKLAFIQALLDRQFLGVKPENLKGLAKFAWISQVNSIDSQVKGYEDKTRTKLTPCQGGVQRGVEPPSLQVEEKEKEKVQDVVTKSKDLINFEELKNFINEKTGRGFRKINEKTRKKYRSLIKDYEKQDIINAVLNAVKSKHHKENNFQYLTPEFFSRPDTIDKYGFDVKQTKPSKEGFVGNIFNDLND